MKDDSKPSHLDTMKKGASTRPTKPLPQQGAKAQVANGVTRATGRGNQWMKEEKPTEEKKEEIPAEST